MKQPNWKVPLLLSATLAGFGSFAYWLQYSHKPKKEKEETSAKKPMPLNDNDQVASIRFKGKNGMIEMKCNELAQKKCKPDASDVSWSITFPKQVKADSGAVHELLNSISTAVATETIDLAEETPEKKQTLLKEYGLTDTDRANANTSFIEVTLENGSKNVVWFGQEHPLGDKTFTGASQGGKFNDRTIFLLSDFVKSKVDQTLTQMRDKRVFDFNRGDIKAFTAKTSGGRIEATSDNGLWTVNQYQGDYPRIETILSAITNLKAKEFPEGDPTRGLKPVVSYALKMPGSDPKADPKASASTSQMKIVTFDLYDKPIKMPAAKGEKPSFDHAYYVKTSARPDVLEVDSLIKTQTDKTVNDVRKASIFSETEKVTATQFLAVGKDLTGPITAQYEKGKWVKRGPEAKGGSDTINYDRVAKLIEVLSNARVSEFVAPGKAPNNASNDQVTIAIGDEKNPKKFHFLFYVSKGKLYAQDINKPGSELDVMDDTVQTSLPWKSDTWKK